MTISTTARIGVYRWSADEDQFLRSHMDLSHQAIEQVVAKFTSGTTIPSPAAEWAQAFFYKTDTGILYYFNGTDNTGSWVTVNNFGGAISTLSFGQSPSDGTSTFAARADHSHGMPALFGASGVALTFGGSTTSGTATTASRADHTHAIPAIDGGSA